MSNFHQQEIERLRDEVSVLQDRLNRAEYSGLNLQQQIRTLEARIKSLEYDLKSSRDQSNTLLADNYKLRDRLNKNPYSDDFYNEN